MLIATCIKSLIFCIYQIERNSDGGVNRLGLVLQVRRMNIGIAARILNVR